MMAMLILGAAAGVILGLGRFKVLALLPVILIVLAGAIGNGVANGLEPRAIAFGTLMAIASPQIGYLVSSLGVSFIIAKLLRVRATKRRPELLHAMQTEIGQQLRAASKIPEPLPSEMVALRARMIDRRGTRPPG